MSRYHGIVIGCGLRIDKSIKIVILISMVETIHVKTSKRIAMIDITTELNNIVKRSEVNEGVCAAYCPHTTGAITINENCDPSVQEDILTSLTTLIPYKADYTHTEGNADAHIKSSLIGSSQFILIRHNGLALGTWQGVFFCEFDGPRSRTVSISFITA